MGLRRSGQSKLESIASATCALTLRMRGPLVVLNTTMAIRRAVTVKSADTASRSGCSLRVLDATKSTAQGMAASRSSAAAQGMPILASGKNSRTPKAVQSLADARTAMTQSAQRIGLMVDAVALLLAISPASRQLSCRPRPKLRFGDQTTPPNPASRARADLAN